jgi:hypothetical protein
LWFQPDSMQGGQTGSRSKDWPPRRQSTKRRAWLGSCGIVQTSGWFGPVAPGGWQNWKTAVLVCSAWNQDRAPIANVNPTGETILIVCATGSSRFCEPLSSSVKRCYTYRLRPSARNQTWKPSRIQSSLQGLSALRPAALRPLAGAMFHQDRRTYSISL